MIVRRVARTAVTTLPTRRITPYGQFVFAPMPNWLLCRTEISLGAKVVYGRLLQYAGKHAAARPRRQTLARDTGMTISALDRYIRQLKKAQLVEIERPNRRGANRYFFPRHPWMEFRDFTSPQSRESTRSCTRQSAKVTTPEDIQRKHSKENGPARFGMTARTERGGEPAPISNILAPLFASRGSPRPKT
jgi:hypothetical protein